jgi:ATP-dependent protease HslVU (ClpYQ) ATPase subunit
VLATLLEDVLFELPESKTQHVVFSDSDVKSKLDEILADEDLTRYIL